MDVVHNVQQCYLLLDSLFFCISFMLVIHFSLSQVVLHLQQFYAMFLKRALYSWRNWKVMVAQFLVPLVFTVVALVVARTFPNHQNAPQLKLALSHYGPTRVPVAVQSGAGPLASVLANKYSSQLPAQLGQLINITGKHSEKDTVLT